MWRKTLSLKIYPKPYNNWYHNLDLPINLDPTIRMTNELRGLRSKTWRVRKKLLCEKKIVRVIPHKIKEDRYKIPYNHANKLNALIQTQENAE